MGGSEPPPTNFNATSGFRLRPELIEALPPAAWSAPVAEAMERVTFRVEPDIDAVDLLRLFLRWGSHAVPVVDDTGELLGVVAKADVLHELCGAPHPEDAGEALARGANAVDFAARPGLCARDIMAKRVLEVGETTPLARAASLIAQGIHPVPVVDVAGRCVGTLSSIDVLRWLARNDRPSEP